jgi:hypothetical protein
MTASLVESRGGEIDAVIAGGWSRFEAGGEEACVATAEIDYGITALLTPLLEQAGDADVDLTMEHVVLLRERVVEAPGSAEEMRFVVGHGRGILGQDQ